MTKMRYTSRADFDRDLKSGTIKLEKHELEWCLWSWWQRKMCDIVTRDGVSVCDWESERRQIDPTKTAWLV
jgi:hypothetical protein